MSTADLPKFAIKVPSSGVAVIEKPGRCYHTLYFTANSPFKQIVTVKIDDQTHTFEGTGEDVDMGRLDISKKSKHMEITFQWQDEKGELHPSSINASPPSLHKRVVQGMIVAENGDDADEDDVVLSLTGRVKRYEE